MIREFPYTNLHELNVDWILRVVKEFLDKYGTVDEFYEQLEGRLSNKTDELIAQLISTSTELIQAYNDNADEKLAELRVIFNGQLEELRVVGSNQISAITQNGVHYMEEIDSLVADLPSDFTSLLAAIAPGYADLSFPIKKGQICWYDHNLYQAKEDITTSESWTSAHWNSVTIASAILLIIQSLNETNSFLNTFLAPGTARLPIAWTAGRWINNVHNADDNANWWLVTETTPYYTAKFASNVKRVKIVPKTGFIFRAFGYSSASISSSAYAQYIASDLATEIEFTPNPNYYYRYCVSNGETATDNPPDDVLTIIPYYTIDDSLTIEGAAADAKATGDRIEELETHISEFDEASELMNIESVTIEANDYFSEAVRIYPIFVSGNISTSEPKIPVANNKRATCKRINVGAYASIRITPPSNIRINVFEYDIDDNYLRTTNNLGLGEEYVKTIDNRPKSDVKYIRFNAF